MRRAVCVSSARASATERCGLAIRSRVPWTIRICWSSRPGAMSVGVDPRRQRHGAANRRVSPRQQRGTAAEGVPDQAGRQRSAEAFDDLVQRPERVVNRRVPGVPSAPGSSAAGTTASRPRPRAGDPPRDRVIRNTESWVGLTIMFSRRLAPPCSTRTAPADPQVRVHHELGLHSGLQRRRSAARILRARRPIADSNGIAQHREDQSREQHL